MPHESICDRMFTVDLRLRAMQLAISETFKVHADRVDELIAKSISDFDMETAVRQEVDNVVYERVRNEIQMAVGSLLDRPEERKAMRKRILLRMQKELTK